jgi:glycosyltransferase involved in cell wall biosynthesis
MAAHNPEGNFATVADDSAAGAALEFSVIVAALNSASSLQRCIDSFRTQSFPKKELIVVDGGSTDGTVELLKANAEWVARWISEPDSGICDAWNKALAMARGEWVIFLGADDTLFAGDVLQHSAHILSSVSPECSVAYGQVQTVTPDGIPICIWGSSWKFARVRFDSVMTLSHQGIFHRRKLFGRVGNFDARLKYAGDYDLLLRALRGNEPFYLGSLVIASMTTGGLSSRPSHSWRVIREFREARLRRNLPGVTRHWIWVLMKALVKSAIASTLGDKQTTELIKSVKRSG